MLYLIMFVNLASFAASLPVAGNVASNHLVNPLSRPGSHHFGAHRFRSMFLHLAEPGEECSLYAAGGQCQYYSCMERMLSCDRTRDLVRSVGHKFCHLSRHFLYNFDAEGQAWVQRTNECTLRRLATSSILLPRQCSAAQKQVEDAFISCASESNFCGIVWANRLPILELFTERHWLTILQAGRECPRDVMTRFVYWSLDSLYR